ncbi:MAG: hypothetical protein RL026_2257 [Pseudomonadota bacterium]
MARFEKVQALYEILCATREPQSMQSLCSQLVASRATVKRLLAFLRDTRGCPITYDRDHNGYVLDRAARRPGEMLLPLLLPSGAELGALLEVEALLAGMPAGVMREETHAIRSRLQRLRSQHLGRMPQENLVRLQRSHARATNPECFRIILAALRERRRLQFEYRARRAQEPVSRSCSPVRLTCYRSNWYLAAWCHLRDDLRVFSLDRIRQPQVLAEAAHQPQPELVASMLDSSYGIHAGQPSAQAVLSFDAHAARWVAEEEWHPLARVEAGRDGTVLMHVPYNQSEELVKEILRHADHCEVLGPDSLRREVAGALARAAARYRDTASVPHPHPGDQEPS